MVLYIGYTQIAFLIWLCLSYLELILLFLFVFLASSFFWIPISFSSEPYDSLEDYPEEEEDEEDEDDEDELLYDRLRFLLPTGFDYYAYPFVYGFFDS